MGEGKQVLNLTDFAVHTEKVHHFNTNSGLKHERKQTFPQPSSRISPPDVGEFPAVWSQCLPSRTVRLDHSGSRLDCVWEEDRGGVHSDRKDKENEAHARHSFWPHYWAGADARLMTGVCYVCFLHHKDPHTLNFMRYNTTAFSLSNLELESSPNCYFRFLTNFVISSTTFCCICHTLAHIFKVEVDWYNSYKVIYFSSFSCPKPYTIKTGTLDHLTQVL